MAAKFWWVATPLGLYLAWLLLRYVRNQWPTRFALNVHISLLLMLYLLITAGLGIFWVANQQLPVFDAHYLFGYAMLLLLGLHLYWNLPLVWRYFKRAPEKSAVRPSAAKLGQIFLFLAVLGLAWQLGRQQAQPVWPEAAPLAANALQTGTGEAKAAHDPNLALVLRYHEYSSESRSSVFARAASVNWGAAPEEFKTYPGAQRIALPKLRSSGHGWDAALHGPRARQQALQLAELGEILYLTAGITARRGGSAMRASPSSGGLFPAELYVAVQNVAQLAPGLYHYDVEGESLEKLADSAGLQQVQAALSQTAPVTLIVSAIMARTGYKYRDRAYRYVAADLGHLLENLRLASHAAGMDTKLLPAFDETRVGRALDLNLQQESVLAAMNLYPAAEAGAATVARRFLPSAAGVSSLGVTGLIQQATSLHLQAGPTTPSSTPGTKGILPLPPTASIKTDVHSLIAQRRSQRRFSQQAVALPALAAMLQRLQINSQLSHALQAHLVINRVQGVAPGIYQFLPGQGLRLVRGGDFAAAAQAAALDQDVIGDAAVVLLISARKDAVLAEGARAYRHMFLEAGMVGERWLLGALAQGLGACPVGAFYDDEAASLLGLDAKQHWVLHFAALGEIAP